MRPQVLVDMGALFAGIAPPAMAAGDGEILELAFAALVADRAVVGVVDHQPFDDLPAHRQRFLVGGRDDHAVLGRQHAGHLDPLDRAVDHLHRADPAGAGLAEGRMPAEVGDGDPDTLGRLEDGNAFGDFHGDVIDDQFWHRSLFERTSPFDDMFLQLIHEMS